MADPTSDPSAAFRAERSARITAYGDDEAWRELSDAWRRAAFERRYMYNFEWLGRPIIQTPVDIVALQELVWSARPDLIIETGIAHGGSLILSASLLALLDLCDQESGGGDAPARRVVGVDIDIRPHNRAAIEAHPLASRIRMIEGSSLAEPVIDAVRREAAARERVMVILDSNHTHDHVLGELEAYAPLVTPGGYCVVFDTVVERLPPDAFPDRPWSPGDSPMTAIDAFLDRLGRDGRRAADGAPLALRSASELDAKLMVSAAPGGFLKRV